MRKKKKWKKNSLVRKFIYYVLCILERKTINFISLYAYPKRIPDAFLSFFFVWLAALLLSLEINVCAREFSALYKFCESSRLNNGRFLKNRARIYVFLVHICFSPEIFRGKIWGRVARIIGIERNARKWTRE